MKPKVFIFVLASFVFVLSLSTTSFADSPNGLTGYWAFDEGTQGLSALDKSGNSNTAAPAGSGGGPSYSTDVPSLGFTDSYSASFNGAQYFAAPASASLDKINDLSFSVWVKFNNTSGNQTIAAKWQVGAKQQWVVQLNSDHVSFWTGDGSTGSADNLQSNTTIAPNTWYNVAGTYTSGSKKLYINGVLDKSDSAASLGVASGTPFTIGSKQNSVGAYFEYLAGEIDDLRVYNGVLNAETVNDLAAGKNVDAPAPVIPPQPDVSIARGVSVATNVLAGVTNNPDPSSLTIVSGPAHGNASIDQNRGTITYTSADAYTGTDSITFNICSLAYQRACSQATIIYNIYAPAPVSAANIKPPDTGYGNNGDLPSGAIYLFGLSVTSVALGGAIYCRRAAIKIILPKLSYEKWCQHWAS